jgi:hypothetical protein
MICKLFSKSNEKIIFQFRRTQLLPSKYYLYYTWIDTFKPRELVILINQISKSIQINVNLFHPQ